MGRIRVYRLNDDPSEALSYSELSQVEISSKKDHPTVVDDNDYNFKVNDLKNWVEERTGATPSQQVYYHCCSGKKIRSQSDNSEPYRYQFESSPSLNDNNNNNDDVPLRTVLARYYEKDKLQRCTYIKNWIGVRLLHHQDEANTDDAAPAIVDSVDERRAPKRRRRSS